jgi:thioredoxin reductase (NADPH)
MLSAMRSEYDIVVAGGGLAGLTAGLTAARLGRSVLVLTGVVPGGLLLTINRIDGFPGFPDGVPGYELCPSVQGQAEDAGADVVCGELERLEATAGGWEIATDGQRTQTGAVIIATGARFRALGVPGEERLRGRGVGTCASCDGPLIGGKTAAVVGGGDSALQEALALAETAAAVLILHRGVELDGQADYRRRVFGQPTIEVRYGTVVEEILGEQSVLALRVRELATDAVEELEAAAVFTFVGLRPNSERFAEQVALDPDGAVLTDGALRTTAAGVFAAGVVRSGAIGRAAAASGEGAAAATVAHAFLAERTWPTATTEPLETV